MMKLSLNTRLNHSFVGLLILFTMVGFTASDQIDLYYFFPDSSQNNLGNLKKEMDTFFDSQRVVIGFQPFLRYSDFVQSIKETMPEFILAPEWLLSLYGDELSLKPFLTASRNGSTSYIKVIMVRKNSGITLANMRDKTLALTSMGPMNDKILNDLLFSDHHIDATQVKKIKVSKDSDAIFALALGQVDMALVVRDNLSKIKSIYPMIVNNLIPLLESKPFSMPVLCYLEKNVSEENMKKMRQLFMDKKNAKELDEISNMLQIDAWIP